MALSQSVQWDDSSSSCSENDDHLDCASPVYKARKLDTENVRRHLSDRTNVPPNSMAEMKRVELPSPMIFSPTRREIKRPAVRRLDHSFKTEESKMEISIYAATQLPSHRLLSTDAESSNQAKGSDFLRILRQDDQPDDMTGKSSSQASDSASPSIESVRSSNDLTTDLTTGLEQTETFLIKSSSKKKSRPRSGLSAKLYKVLKQAESDFTLNKYIQKPDVNDEEDNHRFGISVRVEEISFKTFWLEARCLRLHVPTINESRTVNVVLPIDEVDSLQAGQEILIKKPFQETNMAGENFVFGVKDWNIINIPSQEQSVNEENVQILTWNN